MAEMINWCPSVRPAASLDVSGSAARARAARPELVANISPWLVGMGHLPGGVGQEGEEIRSINEIIIGQDGSHPTYEPMQPLALLGYRILLILYD